MKKIKRIFIMSAVIAVLISGCGSDGTKGNAGNAESSGENTESSEESSQVAGADEMASPIDVVEEGMKPVTADMIKDGIYSIDVSSSSSMFKVVSCELTVKNGKMTAVMTMGGKGYLKVFMGTGQEAVKASEDEYIPFEENKNGEHTFSVPVEALDMAVDCAAFSKNKEKWYDRTLVFRADSISPDCFEDGVINYADSLNLEDGKYTVEVSMTGGTGRSEISSPVILTVADGKIYAQIVWSSPNYDYMKVDGEKYDPVNTEGNSTFEIPVAMFDWKIPIIADTVAMSEPHEIEYTLSFDSGTIEKAE